MRKNKERACLKRFWVRRALMKSVYNYEGITKTITKALRNTIDGIYMRSEDASSLLSYVF